MFNIQEFNAAMTRKAIQKPNKFLIHITPPPTLLTNFRINDVRSTSSMRDERMTGITIMNELQFWAEGVSLPGALNLTQDIYRHSYGITEKKPYRPVFGDIGLIILADGRMDNWRFFNRWHSLVVNRDMSDGDLLSDKEYSAIANPQSAFEISYKEDYQSLVTIHLFDDAGNETMNLTLRNAWPIFMGDISLNWAENNQFMRIPITLTFTDWYINGSAPFTQQSRNAPHAEGRPLPVEGGSFPAPTDIGDDDIG